MNWDAIGAIGEMLGAAAVIGSLIYLSIQIRHNSRQVEEQIRALNADSITAVENAHSNFRRTIISSPQIASLWRKAQESYEDLDADEKVQADTIFQEFCWTWHNTILRMASREFTSNDMEPIIENVLDHNLIPTLQSSGGRKWWAEGQKDYPSSFVELVEDRLR